MRKPQFQTRFIKPAHTAARLLAGVVLHQPDREDAEELIGLALWLESIAGWKSQKDAAQRKRRKNPTQDKT